MHLPYVGVIINMDTPTLHILSFGNNYRFILIEFYSATLVNISAVGGSRRYRVPPVDASRSPSLTRRTEPTAPSAPTTLVLTIRSSLQQYLYCLTVRVLFAFFRLDNIPA